MMRVAPAGLRLLAMVVGSCVLIASNTAASGIVGIESDGWYTWQIDASDDAPGWCCVGWNAGQALTTACDLDNQQNDHSFSRTNDTPTGHMQIYALLKSGTLDRIRALGPHCAIRTNTTVNDLGTMPADVSATWLQQFIEPRSGISTDLMAAIAVHRGKQSRDALLAVATKNPDTGNRKDAIFWLGQVRIRETADEIRRLVFEDSDAEIREQAVVALAQLPADRAAEALISIIEARTLDKKTRRAALFWLVQSGSDPAMEYLTNLFAGN